MSPSLKQHDWANCRPLTEPPDQAPDLESLPALLDLTLDHLEANYISRASIPFAFSR